MGDVPTDAGVAVKDADGERGAGGEGVLEPPQRRLFGVRVGVTGAQVPGLGENGRSEGLDQGLQVGP